MNIVSSFSSAVETAKATVAGAVPGMELGTEAKNATAIKNLDQINTMVRIWLSVTVTIAVAAGWIPEEMDTEKLIMVLSGIYVAASSAWSYVSQIISTKKLGIKLENTL